MTFAALVEKSWRKNILLVVLCELTYDCNFDCTFCYNDRGLKGSKLTLPEWLRVLDELAGMGVLNVVLSGGEPMTHPQFFEIGAHAKKLGFVVRVKTNGHTLRGEALARMQREVDPFVVEVSLHGARAETHERQTRVPGSFARLLANLEEMKAAGLRVRINSTLTRYNEGELDGMYAIAERLGMALTIDPDVTPRDDGDQSPLQLAASDAGLRALMSRGVVVGAPADETCANGGEKHCGAGSSSLCIDPVGNVYPCVQWRRAIGNVHDAALADLWRGAPALAEVRALTVDVKTMLRAQGDGADQMGFCPGTAESLGGEVTAPYDMATRRQQTALVVRGKLRVLG